MKKISIFILMLLLLNFLGCTNNSNTNQLGESPSIHCVVNQCIKIDSDRTIELAIEPENERFKWVFTASNSEIEGQFLFSLSCNPYLNLSNEENFENILKNTNGMVRNDELVFLSEEGEISNYSNSEVQFEYYFYGSKTIYISYANANEQIKNCINAACKNEGEYVYIDSTYTNWMLCPYSIDLCANN